MEAKVISIIKKEHQGNKTDYYEVKRIIDGIEEIKLIKDDERDFFKYLVSYATDLEKEKKECERLLKPHEFIQSLKNYFEVIYIFTNILGCIFLYNPSEIAPLRIFGISALGIGITGEGVFIYLDKKFKNEKAEVNLKKIKKELEKISEYTEKSKYEIERKKTLEQQTRSKLESKAKRDEKEIKVGVDYTFHPDRPTFLKDISLQQYNRVRNKKQHNKFSDVPIYLKERRENIYPQKTVSPEDKNVEVSFGGIETKKIDKKVQPNQVININSNKENQKASFKIDRPSFYVDMPDRSRSAFDEELEIPEYLSRRR